MITFSEGPVCVRILPHQLIEHHPDDNGKEYDEDDEQDNHQNSCMRVGAEVSKPTTSSERVSLGSAIVDLVAVIPTEINFEGIPVLCR